MSFLALFIPDKPAQTLLVCLIFSLTILLDLQTHFHFISLTFYWTGSFDCYKKKQKKSKAQWATNSREILSLLSPLHWDHPILLYWIDCKSSIYNACKFRLFSFDCLWEFYRLCQCYSRWKSFHNQAFLKDISAVTFVLVTTMAW